MLKPLAFATWSLSALSLLSITAQANEVFPDLGVEFAQVTPGYVFGSRWDILRDDNDFGVILSGPSPVEVSTDFFLSSSSDWPSILAPEALLLADFAIPEAVLVDWPELIIPALNAPTQIDSEPLSWSSYDTNSWLRLDEANWDHWGNVTLSADISLGVESSMVFLEPFEDYDYSWAGSVFAMAEPITYPTLGSYLSIGNVDFLASSWEWTERSYVGRILAPESDLNLVSGGMLTELGALNLEVLPGATVHGELVATPLPAAAWLLVGALPVLARRRQRPLGEPRPE